MKIIEGKQAVLRAYLTETGCVLPKRGQNAQLLEPVICSVTELPTAACIPLERVDRPVELSPRSISDGEMQRPVEYLPGSIQEVEIQEPVECVPRRISDIGLQKPVECIIQSISSSMEQTSCAEVQAPVECIPQTVSERPLRTTKAQVIPAAPEWGQMLEGTMSGRKKRKWLAETILHMTDVQ